MNHTNPLLQISGYPLFDKIQIEHILPAVEETLGKLTEAVAALESREKGSFEEIISPLEKIEYTTHRVWGPVSHLMGVKNSPELRTVYEEVLPKIIDFGLRLRQSENIYRALVDLKEGAEWNNLDSVKKRIVEKRILDAKHSGIGLEGEKKKRFQEIAQRLSSISTQFSNNVLDSTKEFHLDLNTKDEIDGLPPTLRSLAAQNYQTANPESTANPEASATTPHAVIGETEGHGVST